MKKPSFFAAILFLTVTTCLGIDQEAYCDYTYYDLGVLEVFSSAEAWNISALFVAGVCYTAGGDPQGCIWSPGSGMRSLGTAGGAYSRAYGVNRLADTSDTPRPRTVWSLPHTSPSAGP